MFRAGKPIRLQDACPPTPNPSSAGKRAEVLDEKDMFFARSCRIWGPRIGALVQGMVISRSSTSRTEIRADSLEPAAHCRDSYLRPGRGLRACVGAPRIRRSSAG